MSILLGISPAWVQERNPTKEAELRSTVNADFQRIEQTQILEAFKNQLQHTGVVHLKFFSSGIYASADNHTWYLLDSTSAESPYNAARFSAPMIQAALRIYSTPSTPLTEQPVRTYQLPELEDRSQELQTLQDNLSSAESRALSATLQKDIAVQRLTILQETLERVIQGKIALTQQIADLQSECEEFQRVADQQSTLLKRLNRDRTNLLAAIRELEEQRSVLQQDLEAQQNIQHELDAKRSEREEALQHLRATIDDLLSEVEKLETAKIILNEHLSSLQQEADSLRKEKQPLQTQIETLTALYNEQSAILESTQARYKSETQELSRALERMKTAHTLDMAALKELTKKCKAEQARHQNEILSLENQLANAKSSLDKVAENNYRDAINTLQQKLDAAQDAHTTKAREHETAISDLENQIQTLQAAESSSTETQARQKTTIANLQQQLRELSDREASVQNAYTQSQSKISALEQELTQSTTRETQLQTSITAIEDRVATLQALQAAQSATQAAHEATIENLQQQLRQVSDREAEFQETIATVEADRDAKARELQTLEAAHSSSTAAQAAQKTTIEDLQQQLEKLSAKEAEFQKSIATVEADRDAKARELQKAHQSKGALEQEMQALRARLAEGQKENATLRKAGEQFQATIAMQTSELKKLHGEMADQRTQAATEREKLNQQLSQLQAAVTQRNSTLQEQFASATKRANEMQQEKNDVLKRHDQLVKDHLSLQESHKTKKAGIGARINLLHRLRFPKQRPVVTTSSLTSSTPKQPLDESTELANQLDNLANELDRILTTRSKSEDYSLNSDLIVSQEYVPHLIALRYLLARDAFKVEGKKATFEIPVPEVISRTIQQYVDHINSELSKMGSTKDNYSTQSSTITKSIREYCDTLLKLPASSSSTNAPLLSEKETLAKQLFTAKNGELIKVRQQFNACAEKINALHPASSLATAKLMPLTKTLLRSMILLPRYKDPDAQKLSQSLTKLREIVYKLVTSVTIGPRA